jgi:hypothetical protein
VLECFRRVTDSREQFVDLSTLLDLYGLEISPEMHAYFLVFGKLGMFKMSLSCQFDKSKALFNFMH